MTTVIVNKETLVDLVITAFEGGSNYWLDRAEYDDEPKEIELRAKGYNPVYASEAYWVGKTCGMTLFFGEEEGEVEKAALTLEGMREALKGDKLPDHIKANIVSENWDAWDADAVVQVAALGEIVYG